MNDKQRWLQRHRNELVLVGILAAGAAVLIFRIAGIDSPTQGERVVEKFGLALFVAVIVRSLALIFDTAQRNVGDYRSSKKAYESAVKGAQSSLWLSQTWLPGFAAQAGDINSSVAPDKQLMLASFQPQSFIFSRVLGRMGVDIDTARGNVAQCAAHFKHLIAHDKLRFSFGHHPGWITIIDDKKVFWGPTPVSQDNNESSEPACWNMDTVNGEQGRFWKRQFKLLWDNYSLTLDKEIKHNKELLKIQCE